MIEIRELRKNYGAFRALDGIDLFVDAGELIALLGSNGAGKSTLMQCILGTTGFEGWIGVEGIDVARDGKRARGRIGYMPQVGSLHPDLTVRETLAFYESFREVDESESLRLLAEVELESKVDQLVGELSGGMQQRLSFAIARLGRPSVMLLDEPTASLDRRSRQILVERLRNLTADGTAVLVSTHLDQELSRIASRVIRLEEGRIVGTYQAHEGMAPVPVGVVR
jgi:lipooligosaccharide transport system ATP-binding protein